TLSWDEDHGDEALFVLDGEVDLDGAVPEPGGAVLVEAGVPAVLTARRATTLLHFGPADPAPPTEGIRGPAVTEGHGTHVVRGGFDFDGLVGVPVGLRYF